VQGDGGFGGVSYAPPDPQLWLPLGSTRPEDGGCFVWGEYIMYRQSNPMKDQQVAVRGFILADDSVNIAPPLSSGVFIGSRDEVLNTKQVSGPGTYQPGFVTGIGWKFKDQSSVSFSFLHLTDTQYRAVATLAKPGDTFRSDFADSYLTAYVYNFPPEFIGPSQKIAPPASPQATFGIWDGASVMTEQFLQRFEQYEITYRVPVFDTECYRLSGLVGPRIVWQWERYKWTTVAQTFDGMGGGGADTAIYTNITSNRMYGVKAGCSNEWYLGHGFACQLDLQVALFLDAVKERAQYELGIPWLGTKNKRARLEYTVAGEFQPTLGLMWYPAEGIQLYVGYDLMLFANTLSSPRPIDLNYSSLTPRWESTFRSIDGWRAGVMFHF
jgi:hypothetical protein